MKNIKTILLFTVIIIFTSISYGETRDCDYKSKVQQAICEKGADRDASSGKTKKSGKKGNNFWKKLKNLGGENVGEPG